MNPKEQNAVRVFTGEEGRLPSAVFSTLEHAMQWIETNRCSGLLTSYPLDLPLYDWAMENGYLKSELPSPRIESFTSAYREHYHFADGKKVAG
jgi:hypothetical protein